MPMRYSGVDDPAALEKGLGQFSLDLVVPETVEQSYVLKIFGSED